MVRPSTVTEPLLETASGLKGSKRLPSCLSGPISCLESGLEAGAAAPTDETSARLTAAHTPDMNRFIPDLPGKMRSIHINIFARRSPAALGVTNNSLDFDHLERQQMSHVGTVPQTTVRDAVLTLLRSF